jgi:hypothetical protein
LLSACLCLVAPPPLVFTPHLLPCRRIIIARQQLLSLLTHPSCCCTHPAVTSTLLLQLRGFAQGIEIGVALIGDFGAVVCRFGAAELRPVLTQMLAALNKAPASALANLPELTAALTRLEPATVQVRSCCSHGPVTCIDARAEPLQGLGLLVPSRRSTCLRANLDAPWPVIFQLLHTHSYSHTVSHTCTHTHLYTHTHTSASCQAFFSIPPATFNALVPVLAKIPPATVSSQLSALGAADKETLEKMALFLDKVSAVYMRKQCTAQLQSHTLQMMAPCRGPHLSGTLSTSAPAC